MSCMRSNWRFTRGAFLRRRWLFMPLACMTLPVAVILKRFLAPLCVLSFALLPMGIRSLSFWSAASLAGWRHVHRHGATLHTGSLFHCAVFLELNQELIEKIATELRVCDRTATEQDSQFHLVAAIEEPRGLTALGLQVGLADLGLDANFLEPGDMLIAARLSLFAA